MIRILAWFLWLGLLSTGSAEAFSGAPDSPAPQAGTGGITDVAIQHIPLGILYLLSNPYHLALLIGLLLLMQSWRDLVLVMLSYMAGHSVALGLTHFGWLSPPDIAIGAIMAGSVLFLAWEANNVGSQPDWRRLLTAVLLILVVTLTGVFTTVYGSGTIPVLTWIGGLLAFAAYTGWLNAGGGRLGANPGLSAGFGLIHGAGFAAGLSADNFSVGDRIPALVGFNLGLEIGLALFVGLSVLVVILAQRILPDRWLELVRTGWIALLAALGSYGFIAQGWS